MNMPSFVAPHFVPQNNAPRQNEAQESGDGSDEQIMCEKLFDFDEIESE